jgi:hypothetical protein
MFVVFINMKSTTEFTDMAYDVLEVLSKDADFLYDTIETYIKDTQKSNKSEIIEIRHSGMIQEIVCIA